MVELKLNYDELTEMSLDEAKKIIDGQDHSGMSYGLVRVMIKSFCDRGEEFYTYTG